mgnify:CR=1 FL=1
MIKVKVQIKGEIIVKLKEDAQILLDFCLNWFPNKLYIFEKVLTRRERLSMDTIWKNVALRK